MPTPFTAPEPVEHSVEGVPRKFYPISVGALFRLRGIAKPLAKAISALLAPTTNDVGSEIVRSGSHEKVETRAITSDLAKLRFEQKQGAIEALGDGLLNDGARNTLAEMCIDSMRDDLPKKEWTVDRFIAEIQAPAFMEMLAGVAKANKKLFDPLKVQVETLTSTLRASLGSQQPNAPAAPSPSNEATTNSGST